MKAIILSLPIPVQIIQIAHLWVITHRLGTTALKVPSQKMELEGERSILQPKIDFDAYIPVPVGEYWSFTIVL